MIYNIFLNIQNLVIMIYNIFLYVSLVNYYIVKLQGCFYFIKQKSGETKK